MNSMQPFVEYETNYMRLSSALWMNGNLHDVRPAPSTRVRASAQGPAQP